MHQQNAFSLMFYEGSDVARFPGGLECRFHTPHQTCFGAEAATLPEMRYQGGLRDADCVSTSTEGSKNTCTRTFSSSWLHEHLLVHSLACALSKSQTAWLCFAPSRHRYSTVRAGRSGRHNLPRLSEAIHHSTRPNFRCSETPHSFTENRQKEWGAACMQHGALSSSEEPGRLDSME